MVLTHTQTHTHTLTCRSCIGLRTHAGISPWTRCTRDICGTVPSLTAASPTAVCSASRWRAKNLPSARKWRKRGKMRTTKKKWSRGEVSHHRPPVLPGRATPDTATPTASIEPSRRKLTIYQDRRSRGSTSLFSLAIESPWSRWWCTRAPRTGISSDSHLPLAWRARTQPLSVISKRSRWTAFICLKYLSHGLTRWHQGWQGYCKAAPKSVFS